MLYLKKRLDSEDPSVVKVATTKQKILNGNAQKDADERLYSIH